MKSLFDGANVTIMGDAIYNKGTINKTYINGQVKKQPSHPQSQTKDIEEAEIVPDVKIPSFFRTDTHSITKIQEKWEEALQIKGGKTKIIRFVKQNARKDGYFKLSGTYEQLAAAFNEAQNKFTFTANDFENANKPLKKITTN